MTDAMDKAVAAAADAALNDLCDRKGIKHELNAVRYDDPEIWEEIRQAVGTAAVIAFLRNWEPSNTACIAYLEAVLEQRLMSKPCIQAAAKAEADRLERGNG